jgi:hypothetical protein
MQGIFKALKRRVDAILGLYVQSGRNVFTTTNLEESVNFEVSFRDVNYTIVIDAESKKYFSGKQLS